MGPGEWQKGKWQFFARIVFIARVFSHHWVSVLHVLYAYFFPFHLLRLPSRNTHLSHTYDTSSSGGMAELRWHPIAHMPWHAHSTVVRSHNSDDDYFTFRLLHIVTVIAVGYCCACTTMCGKKVEGKKYAANRMPNRNQKDTRKNAKVCDQNFLHSSSRFGCDVSDVVSFPKSS